MNTANWRRSGQWRRSLHAKIGLFLLAAGSAFQAAASFIVTVIDDDARSVKAIESVKNVAARNGVKVTFAAVASYLKKMPDVTARLQQYEKEGHETASHSLTHSFKIWKAGEAADLRAIEREVRDADVIFSELGLKPRSFVYPFGNFPRKVRRDIFEIIRKYYPVAFNARGDINFPGKIHPLYVSRHPLRKHNSLFMTKRMIDEAASADNSWLVILTHSANSDFSAVMLEETISYAKKSGAVFLPVSAAWRQVVSWPQISEDRIPDYSLSGDLLNAAYFHLPYLLAAAAAGILVCGGVIYLILRRRRSRKKTV